MFKDYRAGDVVTIVNLPQHIQNLTLIGKQGVVNLNDPSERETPLQVYIGGREDHNLFHFEYENVKIDPINNTQDLLESKKPE